MPPKSFLKKHGFIYDDEQPDIGHRYKTEPGHDIDYDRWANNEERCWIDSSQSVQKEEYAVHILNYPFDLGRDYHQPKGYAKAYFQENKNIKIYIPQSKTQLKQVTTPLAFMTAHKDLALLTEEEIASLAGTLQLSKKQQKTIDYATMQLRQIYSFDHMSSDKDQSAEFEKQELVTFSLRHFKRLNIARFKLMIDEQGRKKQPIGLCLGSEHYRWRLTYLEKILKTCDVVGLKIDSEDTYHSVKNVLMNNADALGKVTTLVVQADKGYFNDSATYHAAEILPFCKQLKYLSLTCYLSDYENKKTVIFPEDFPLDYSWASQVEELNLDGLCPPFLYNLPNLRKLNSQKVAFDWQKLGISSPHIQEITLRKATVDDIVAILRNFPQLQTLNIISMKEKAKDEKESKENVFSSIKKTNLRDLSISDGSLSSNSLFSLLQCSPELQTLALNCQITHAENKEEQSELALPSLIHFSGQGELPSATVIRILENAEKIESVDLSKLNTTISLKDVPDKNNFLAKVKKFKAIGSKFSGLIALALLRNANDLENLYLQDLAEPKNDSDASNECSVYFPKLKYIGLIKVIRSVVQSILSTAFAAEELMISHSYPYDDEPKAFFLEVNTPYSSLTSLNLSNLILDSKEFVNILMQCPGLRTINLTECYFLKDDPKIWEEISLNFPHLTQVILKKSTIPASFVTAVFTGAPLIEAFDTEYADITGELLNISTANCPKLNLVKLSNVTLSSNVLAYILRAAALKIESLALNSLTVRPSTVKLEPCSLPQLDSLSIGNLNLLEEIKPGSNLKSLEIMLWGAREKNIPLPEHIDFSGLEELTLEGNVDNAMPLLDHVFSKAESLRRIEYSCYFSSDGQQNFNKLLIKHKEKLANLECFILDASTENTPRHLLQYLPRVTQLKIGSLEGNYEKRRLDLSNLIELEFTHINGKNDLIEILRAAKNLRRVKLSFDKEADTYEILSCLIHLKLLPKNLDNLKLEGISSIYAEHIKELYPHAQVYVEGSYYADIDEYENPHSRGGFGGSGPGAFLDSASQSRFFSSSHLEKKSHAKDSSSSSQSTPSSHWMDKSEVVLDSNVRNTDKTFHLQQYILPNAKGFPDVHSCILNTYKDLVLENGRFVLKEGKPKLIELKNVEKKDNLKAYHIAQKKRDHAYDLSHYYGQIPLRLIPGKLMRLPGATTLEEIKYFEVNPPVGLSFFRDTETSRCYVMLAEKQLGDKKNSDPKPLDYTEFTLGYVLKSTVKSGYTNPFPRMEKKEAEAIAAAVKFQKTRVNQYSLAELSDLLDHYDKEEILQAVLMLMNDTSEWGPKDISLETKDDVELLNALLKHRTGRCQQQAILIKALADCLDIPCMLDESGSHVTPRIFYKNAWYEAGQWLRLRIGGYESKEQIYAMAHMPNKSSVSRGSHSNIESKLAENKETKNSSARTSTPTKQSFDEYYSALNAKLEEKPIAKRNALLYCMSDTSLLSLAGEILQYHEKNNEEAFYIDDLDEIGPNAFSIGNDGQGVKVNSALKQFVEKQALQAEKTGKPATGTLIINCSKSSSGIFSAYQALDPRVRKLGDIGTLVPGIKIICLSEKSKIRTDKSFNSRFTIKPDNPNDFVDQKVVLDDDFVLKRCVKKADDEKAFLSTDLYYGDFYKTELLGKPVQTETGQKFQATEFSELLLKSEEEKKAEEKLETKHQPKGLEIVNPCVGDIRDLHKNNRDLYLTLLRAKAQNKVFVNGKNCQLPKDFDFSLTQKKYDFSKECVYEQLTNKNRKECDYVLNSETYSHFFKRFQCKSGKLSENANGILAEHANKELTIRVTHQLVHAGLWQRLFFHARKNHVRLRLILDPGVKIPSVEIASAPPQQEAKRLQGLEIKESKQDSKEIKSSKENNKLTTTRVLENKAISDLPTFSVISSVDTNASADEIAKALDARLVYVSKTHAFNDLFESFKRSQSMSEEKSGLPRYDYLEGELISLLTNGKTAVLAGQFSPVLAAKLSTLVASKPYLRLNGEDKPITGRLIIVTKDYHLFPTTGERITHHPQVEKKVEKKKIEEKKAVVEEKKSIPVAMSLETKAIDEQAVRLDVLADRLHKEDDTCTYLEGPTAAGKSTMVRRFLPGFYEKKYGKPVRVFEGDISKFKECLEFQVKNPDILCVWFADEANLKPSGTYDFLQGYYQKHKPGIMLDRKFYPKNPNVKVILAGNSDKDCIGRQKQDLIENHPEMKITVNPLSHSYVKEFILKPLLKELLPESKPSVNYDEVIDIFFAGTKLVSSHNDVTIRNWNQMCFRFAMFLTMHSERFADKQTGVNVLQAAAMAAHDELEYLIPSAVSSELQKILFKSTKAYSELAQKIDCEAAVEIRKKLAALPPRKEGPRFHLTESRYHLARLFEDQLMIRQFLKNYPHYSGEGIRCVAFEGASAIGKTLMPLDILEALGFVELADAKPDTDPDKIYCVVTPSNLADNDKAFHCGYLTFIDEYNALMREGMFNGYATGVDQHGQKAKEGKGRWRLIATQNPSTTYDDRVAQSRASRNRFHTMPVREYPLDEQYRILLARGVPQSVAYDLTRIYASSDSKRTWREIDAIADHVLAKDGPVKPSSQSHVSIFAEKAVQPVELPKASQSSCVMQ